MRETFSKAMSFIFKWEGGYSYDPDDPGGETKYGISKRSYSNLNIQDLTREDAAEIYRKDYWDKMDCDNLSCPMDIIVFDTAVNMGTSRAKVLLQESVDWKDYLLNRIGFYLKIVKPQTAKFLQGWINRVIDLKRFI